MIVLYQKKTSINLSTYPSAPINLKIISQSLTSISIFWENPTNNEGDSIIKYELIIYNSDKSSIFRN